MKYSFLPLALLLICTTVQAKRMSPATINPIKIESNEYTVKSVALMCGTETTSCGMKVSVIATDLTTGKEKWDRDLYVRTWEKDLEQDVQWVYPASFKLKAKQLVLVDERGTKFSIDSTTGKLLSPKAPVFYGP